jgi:hypothetical protein
MKKIFIAILAVAALAACNKSEIVESAPSAEIAFDNAFVNNATKATDLNANNLADFGVYGHVYANESNTQGLIFDNETVSGGLGNYTYQNTQYWIANAKYSFAAFAPKTGAAWAYATTDAKNGTVTFTQPATADQDFLFAYDSRETAEVSSQPEKVGFTFNHMLSRVQFTFVNAFESTTDIKLTVTDVHITDSYKKGTLEVVDGEVEEWAVAEADKNLNVAFGNVLAGELASGNASGKTEHFYLIPADATYNVTFKVQLNQAGAKFNYDRTATVILPLEMGKSYNVAASLNGQNVLENELYPIEFDVKEITDWADYQDFEVDATPVATAEELLAAAAKGGKIFMLNDIALSEILVLSADAVLDGKGNTLSSTAGRAINVSGTENVTIKNLTVKCTGERGVNLIQNAKNVVLENVNVTASNYAVNVAGSAAGANVTVANSELQGLNVVNIAAAEVLVNLTDTKLYCNDKTSAENYAAIMINKEATNSKVTATNCEFVVSDTSAAGSYSAEGSSIELINCTGSNKINHSKFAIYYPTGQYYVCETLEGLLPVVKNGETITLINNTVLTETLVIPSGKNFTFDLNGYTLSAESAAKGHNTMITLSAGSSMTIADSKGNGKISYTYNGVGDPSFGWGSYAVENRGGNLTIASGTIEMLCDLNTPAGNVHMYCAVQNYSGATVVNGGTLSCPTYRSLRVNNGSVTFNGGVMDGQVWMQPFSENTSITINGGTFAPRGNDGSSVYVENSSKTVNMNITGGTFTTKIGCAAPKNAGAFGSVKGGTFTTSAKENTNAYLIAAGYSFVENGENWVVKAN